MHKKNLITSFGLLVFFCLFFVASPIRAAIDYQNIPENTWTKVDESFDGPGISILKDSGMALDDIHQKLLIMGGGHADGWTNAIWAWDINNGGWREMYEPDPINVLTMKQCQANVDNVNYPGMWMPSGRPISRHTWYSMNFFSNKGLMFVSGGVTYSGPTTTGTNLSYGFVPTDSPWCYASSPTDRWTFNPETYEWTYVGAHMGNYYGDRYSFNDVSPSQIRAAVYAPDTQKMYAIESVYYSAMAVWSYDTNTDSWTMLKRVKSPSVPAWRDEYSIAYDSLRHRLMMYGGTSSTSSTNELWMFDLNTNTWTNMNPTGADHPTGVQSGGLAYDSDEDVFVVYEGGLGLWIYDPNTNEWLPDPGAANPVKPSNQSVEPNIHGTFQYDPQHKVFLLVNTSSTYRAEVWVYKYKQSTINPPAPVPLPDAPYNYTLLNSGEVKVAQGDSASTNLSVVLSSGTGQQANFAVSGLPSGVTYSMPSSCTVECSLTLQINTDSTTPIGIYPITITSTSGTLTRFSKFNLIVNVPTGYSVIDFVPAISDMYKYSSRSDLTGDGTVNTRDLGVMMSNWK